jgi:hypothetical protein
MKKAEIIPIVVVTLGRISTELEKRIEGIGISL